MTNIKRSSIVGFHNIKNKVSRNAFDLSHRHMFTAQIGELLPIFVQWCNPNETFKLGYNGFTRTQPLQTAAFTRLKENVQYYFVPFQSLWKYFEQQVTNMTKGQSGENISRIALSASEDTPITTQLPYLNYNFFNDLLSLMFTDMCNDFIAVWNNNRNNTTIQMFMDKCPQWFEHGSLRSARIVKLLRALGYLNSDADTYDVCSSIIAYGHTLTANDEMSLNGFQGSQYGFLRGANVFGIENAPNLSIFPLLAYQKIINDHYLYRQWQPYKSYACNIDYLLPTDSMNFAAKLGNKPYDAALFKMGQSNLPLDYFNGVLPKAQYGDESAATVDSNYLTGTVNLRATTSSPTNTGNSSVSPNTHGGNLINNGGVVAVSSDGPSSAPYQAAINTPHTHTINTSASVGLNGTNELKISSLRSAIALQKYKEIQESNDSDFASQVLAHFGIKPKHDDYKSYFIGGGDSVLDINPQVNQNLADGNDPTIKATGAGQLSCGCKFTSDTYGIIIGIYRCVPQLDFAHCGVDRNLFKTDASDFPIPEFDRLGMQTQYRCEVNAPRFITKRANGTYDQFANLDMSTTYGYLPRYAELKTTYDRYEGAFLNSLRTWVTGYDEKVLQRWNRPPVSGGSVTDMATIEELLPCEPSICDNLFVDQTALTCDNDKLLIGSVNTCVAIRPFSVYGLPYSK